MAWCQAYGVLETTDARDLAVLYRQYNAVCNAHQFDQLGKFIAQDVQVNGEHQGLTGYVRGLAEVVRAFPNYRWDLKHLLVDGDWVAAHFFDTGTHLGTFLGTPTTGRAVSTQEFAIYRHKGSVR